MAKTDEKTKSYPPVIPVSTLTGFTETLKNTTVPPVIDASLLTKMSGSTRSALMSGMRFLGLVNSAGVVDTKLHQLVRAYGTTGWKEAVIELLLPAFDEIIEGINLDHGTANQLVEAFRTKGNVDGQMLEKAVRFYLTLMTEAGVTYSPHFKSRTIRKPGPKRPKKPKGRAGDGDGDGDDEEQDLDEDRGRRRNHGGGGGGDSIQFDAQASERFVIPIPGKGNTTIVLPKSIDADDWEMVKIMLDAYVGRLVKSGKA